ncbi:MAG: helix-turn-helix transcriptional regulator [Pseudomonadota bacterium]
MPVPSDPSALILAAIVFALSQVTLALVLLFRERPLGQQQWFYVAFLVATAGYLLHPILSGPGVDFVLSVLTLLIPGAFFLFSLSLFDDGFVLRAWHFVAVGLTVLPPIVAATLALLGMNPMSLLLVELPQMLEFVILAYALATTVRFWSADLVPSRRPLRLWISGFAGSYIFLLVLLRELILPESEVLATVQYLPPALVMLATNVLMLGYRGGLWAGRTQGTQIQRAAPNPVEDASATPKVEDRDKEALAALSRLMNEEHIYREMGLTLTDLARRSEIPAYRLRQLINAGLGYRNFNDFLNRYRIDEAAERLRDAAQQDTQVLVIALDAGFRSLSTFNKAFKAMFSTTPTEYRRAALDT